MDETKRWPDNVLTTKEYIMSRYPPFHDVVEVVDGIGWSDTGSILQYLRISSLSHEMIRWMLHYYRSCLRLCNNSGCNILQSEAACYGSLKTPDTFLLRAILEEDPTLINAHDIYGNCVFSYMRFDMECPNMSNPLLHVLLDYSKEQFPQKLLMQGNRTLWGRRANFWIKTILQARAHCKWIATIVQKHRLISGSKDTSWLVAQFIWSTRATSVWLPSNWEKLFFEIK